MSASHEQGALGASLDLRDLHAANIARQAEWCPDQVPDLSFRGNELGGECGEAQNVIKKLERERQGWRGSRATKDDLADELADVVICADLCAVTADIDLGAAVRRKFNATSDKQGLSIRLADPASAPASGAERMTAGEEPRRMAEGCCSAVSPCSHQRRDPYSLCAICRKANGLTDKILSANPAPATPPGVPDSVRALSEAVIVASAVSTVERLENAAVGGLFHCEADREEAVEIIAETIRGATHPAGQSKAEGPDDPIPGGFGFEPISSALAADVANFHPAGQSAGSGAETIAVQKRDLVEMTAAAFAVDPSVPTEAQGNRLFAAANKLAGYLPSGLECMGCGSRESIESIQTRGFVSCCPERKMQPAPDSTRTGDEGTEELREEVAYWRRDLSARLWSMTALYKAALERGEGDRAADLANALRSALASYHDAEAGEWHDRCELCGEFVRDGEARAAWEDVSGHARCLSEDEKGHVDPHGDEDLARRVEEAQAALDASWPEAALAACPAAPEAQGAWSFDMEAAPRDGTPLDLWCYQRRYINYRWDHEGRAGGWWSDASHKHRDWRDRECLMPASVTAWRLADAPPSSGQGGR